jgi:hypothetical protein
MRMTLAIMLLGVTVGSGSAGAQQPADSIVGACLNRDTSTAWQRISVEWSTERSWSNDSLRRALVELAKADQAVRIGVADSAKNPAFMRRMARQDSIGLAHLREIIGHFGWPTKSMVGANGASAAFLIAQHNPDIQPEVLRLMKALPPGEYQTAELAMMEDRILALSGRPQKYGTQLKPITAAGLEFYPIDSLPRLEARRAAAGLPPMNVYLCMMQGFTGRAPKWPP